MSLPCCLKQMLHLSCWCQDPTIRERAPVAKRGSQFRPHSATPPMMESEVLSCMTLHDCEWRMGEKNTHYMVQIAWNMIEQWRSIVIALVWRWRVLIRFENDNRLDAVGCLKPSSFSSPRWRKGPAALPAPAGGDTAMCQVATIFCLLQRFEMIWIYVIWTRLNFQSCSNGIHHCLREVIMQNDRVPEQNIRIFLHDAWFLILKPWKAQVQQQPQSFCWTKRNVYQRSVFTSKIFGEIFGTLFWWVRQWLSVLEAESLLDIFLLFQTVTVPLQ